MGILFSNTPFTGTLTGPLSLIQTLASPTAGTFQAAFGANLTISPTSINNTLWQGIGVTLQDAVGEAYGVNGTLTAISGTAGSVTTNMISAVTGGFFASISGLTNGSGNINTAIGVDALVKTGTGSSGIANAYGVQATIQQNSGTGSITTAYGMYIRSMTTAGAGITTQVGLQIDSQNVGASAFAIRTGLGAVSFGDAVSILAGKGINLGDTTLKNYQEGTFTPTFTGLTVVNGTGSATYTGRYTRIGNRVDWEVLIAVTGTCTTASTSGVTNVNNLPFSSVVASTNLSASSSLTSNGVGYTAGIQAWTPSWSATNNNITLTGTIWL